MSDIAVDVQGVSKRFRLAHGKLQLAQGARHPRRADPARGLLGAEGRLVRGARGGDGRDPGPQRLGQVDAAQVHLRRAPADLGRGRRAGQAGRAARARRRLPAGPDRRENIYLNGSLLGMSKKEVDRVFDDIVDFSELEEFIDGQVKFYSSGMYVRLGFAVAVNVDPDILVSTRCWRSATSASSASASTG